MPNASRQPVDLHAGDCIELAAMGRGDHLIQRRAAILRARDPLVNELAHNLQLPSEPVAPESVQLGGDRLIVGAHPAVERYAHLRVPASSGSIGAARSIPVHTHKRDDRDILEFMMASHRSMAYIVEKAKGARPFFLLIQWASPAS